MFFNAGKCDWLVVGLGNPGKKYELSRHNTGFRALDAVCEKNGIRVSRARFSGLTGTGTVGGVRIVALKPTTFMNLSGASVEAAAGYYKIPPERVLVLFDDISLEPGHIRIRAEGSAGGHNGVRSIIDCLGTEAFPRVKIGVGGKPNPDCDLADWVLSMPSSQDRKRIESRADDVCGAVELIVQGKLELAQSRYNQ
ncbi:MAG: aminoacyl-tRNA hydrolase [Oscillospiraceae bacterium]|nr:aminoacyl-tRNA hydrolase [Oscillospiraceae bacterium]